MLGDWIKQERKRLGWTQRELAARAGLAQTYISQLELNQRQLLREDTLLRLAKAFGMTVDDMEIAAGMVIVAPEDAMTYVDVVLTRRVRERGRPAEEGRVVGVRRTVPVIYGSEGYEIVRSWDELPARDRRKVVILQVMTPEEYEAHQARLDAQIRELPIMASLDGTEQDIPDLAWLISQLSAEDQAAVRGYAHALWDRQQQRQGAPKPGDSEHKHVRS